MNQTLRKTTLLAVAGAALFTGSARAYNTGDFVIGFRQAGNANDIAGSVTLTNFTTVQTFDLGTVNSAFSSTFNNANWFSDGTILWGLAATNDTTNAPTNINWITSPETVGGNESAALTGKTATQTGTIQSRVNASGNGTGSPFTVTTISGSTLVEQANSTNAQAWQKYMAGGSIVGGADWGFYGNNLTQANFGSGVAGQTLDVYELPIGAGLAGTDRGDFSLSFNSETDDLMLTFTPDSFEPVPEPSTCVAASLAVAGLLLMHVKRRATRNSPGYA